MKLIKVPFCGGGLGRTSGCELAPELVLKHLNDVYLNEECQDFKCLAEEAIVDNANISETSRAVEQLISATGKAIIIGGDHSVTYSAFRAFSKKHEEAGMIVFDAHPDLEKDFSPPTHEAYLRALIEEEALNPERLVLVGIRNPSKNEIEYMNKQRIKWFSMKELFEESARELCDALMSVARQWQALYISIDIDAVDPAFAPGTSCPEPGGLSSRELIYFVQRLKKLPNFKMADVVEINPSRDKDYMTAKLGAKLVRELYCL